MKSALIFVVAATLFSGALALECYYCNAPDCSGANAADLEVETCRTGLFSNYQGDAETTPAEEEDGTTSGDVAESTSGSANNADSTTAAATSEDQTTSTPTVAGPAQEETASTTETSATTKKPWKLRPRPTWAHWKLGSTPMCINSTSKGWFGRTKSFKGCVYTRFDIDPCFQLKLTGQVKTCTACKDNKCN